MTDNKNLNNELNDEELDTVNGGVGANPDLNPMTGVKKTFTEDIFNARAQNQKLEVKVGAGNNNEDNLQSGASPLNGKNPFGARFGFGKKFGRNQKKLDD